MLTADQTKKFWGHVRKGALKGDCWLWEGARSGKYGVMFINKYQVSVHRIAYELEIGHLDKSKFIRRTCGNVFCVKPAHLELSARKTISINKKGTHVSFDERCKRYNDKYPFQITEIRDRRLAEYEEISA